MAFAFGLRSLEAIEEALPRGQYEVLTRHCTEEGA
jgi:hypothetical protein